MITKTGAFGPVDAAELTGVLGQVAAMRAHQLEHAILHDVQYRAGHYYGIAELRLRGARGASAHTYVGLTTATVPVAADGHTVPAGSGELFIWEHPSDPLLPGLPIAAIPAQVQRHFAPDRELAGLHTVIYRPMSRAVFQVRLAPRSPGALGETIFLKVLRAGEAQPLYQIHQGLAAAGVPVVKPVVPPVDDVLALAGGNGVSLGEYTKTEGSPNRFDPTELIDVLDRFPVEVLELPHRASWADRHLEFTAAALRATPDDQDRVQRLGDRLASAHLGLDLGPIVPTHGDLYEAHILVDPVTGRIQHLLDVDGAGPGYRVDDYACLIGHLAVLGAPEGKGWGWQAALRTFRRLAHYTNARALAVRSAAVVVSLIPGYQPDPALQARGRAYVTVAQGLLELR